jgi:adenosylmethionine-8-amino-7-oxononanoate aminotransferase
MTRVFFSTGGSEAVETALKLARQYWKLAGSPQRTKFISLQRAYHGVGYGGLSANGVPAIGETRGKGLMIGVELVVDKNTKARFAPADQFGHTDARRCRDNGVLIRNLYDTFIISPPLTLEKLHVDRIVEVMDEALSFQTKEYARK